MNCGKLYHFPPYFVISSSLSLHSPLILPSPHPPYMMRQLLRKPLVFQCLQFLKTSFFIILAWRLSMGDILVTPIEIVVPVGCHDHDTHRIVERKQENPHVIFPLRSRSSRKLTQNAVFCGAVARRCASRRFRLYAASGCDLSDFRSAAREKDDKYDDKTITEG